MRNSSFHEIYHDKNSKDQRSEALKNTPKDADRIFSPETSPRVISMLRFQMDLDSKDKIVESVKDWPFLSLNDLVRLSKNGLITCVNLDQLDNYLAAWNGRPLDNAQAEDDLTKPRVDDSFSNSDLFTLVPFSVKRNDEENFDGQDKYLLLHFDEEVLSPGEPTSTRMWLNALAKYYDFSGLKVAEIFSGSAPAAVLAGLGGAEIADAYELNERANAVAQKNYDFHNIKGQIFKSDVWSAAKENAPEGGYDRIVGNPPFNPKSKAESAEKRMLEMVQDQGYQVLLKFLEGLPDVLAKNGKAIILYENLPVTLHPDPEMKKGQKNAIEMLVDQFNADPKFPYVFKIEEKIRLRRFRGKDRPLTTFVVVEIEVEAKTI
jgi:methylase of polypeptide subunit release factors